jgi:hypothetical protein
MASVNDGSQSQAEMRWWETEQGHVTARIAGELDIVSVKRLRGAPVWPCSSGWPTASARSGSTAPAC